MGFKVSHHFQTELYEHSYLLTKSSHNIILLTVSAQQVYYYRWV